LLRNLLRNKISTANPPPEANKLDCSSVLASVLKKKTECLRGN